VRKVIYSMLQSLDGFISSPNEPAGALSPDEELHRFANEQEAEAGTHLYGRRFYEVMAGHWPTADTNPASTEVEAEYARLWQKVPTVVFSRTLTEAPAADRIVSGDVAGVVRELKAQPGKDMVVGGAGLAAELIRLGLVDEYRLLLQPVLLGAGTRFFPELTRGIPLRPVESRTFDSGTVYLRYAVR
jgi:dihydrofolate reductase